MDSRLIDKEKDALEAIASYMKNELKQRIDYINKRSKIDPIPQPEQDFWDKCTQIFEQDVSSLSKFETDIEDDSNAGTDADADLNESHGGWQDAMEVFKAAYRYVKRAYGISEDQESQENQEDQEGQKNQKSPLDKQFDCFCEKLEMMSKTADYPVLGSTDFTHLPYMLNLQSEAICALLPYLLTAYTFSFWNSRFFSRGKLLTLISGSEADLEEKYGDTSFGSLEVAKLRDRLNQFAQVFSLASVLFGSDSEDCPIPSEPDSKGRPVPFCVSLKKGGSKHSYVMYEEDLNPVFDFWCKAVSECASLAEEGGFPLNIDLESCKGLYTSYIHSD